MRLSELRVPRRLAAALERDPQIGREAAGGRGLVEIVTSERYLTTALAGMAPWEQEALAAIVRRYASLPFSEADAVRALPGPFLSGAEIRTALTLLCRRGILFRLNRNGPEPVPLFFVPDEALPVWHRLLLPPPPEPTAAAEPDIRSAAATGFPTWAEPSGVVGGFGGDRSVGRDGMAVPGSGMAVQGSMAVQEGNNADGGLACNGGGLVRELLRMLVMAHATPLLLTKSGRLAKPALKKLAAAVRLDGRPFAAEAQRFAERLPPGPIGEKEAACALLLQLALSMGLLVRDGQSYRTCGQAVRRLLARPESDIAAALYEQWKRLRLAETADGCGPGEAGGIGGFGGSDISGDSAGGTGNSRGPFGGIGPTREPENSKGVSGKRPGGIGTPGKPSGAPCKVGGAGGFPAASLSVATVVERLQRHRWYRAAAIGRWLERSGCTGSRETAGELVQSWLESLAAFGWVRFAEAADGQQLFMVTGGPALPQIEGRESGEGRRNGDDRQNGDGRCSGDGRRNGNGAADPGTFSAGMLYIQPDFEILAPPDTLLYVHWQLLKTTELVREDAVSIYRLTKESWLRAAPTPKLADEQIRFLADAAKFGMPDQVAETLRRWTEDFGGREQLPDDGGLSPDGGESSSDSGELPVADNQPDAGGSSISPYELSEDLPELSSLFPDAAKLPQMWLARCRGYHPSTLRHMVHQALAWRTRLKLAGTWNREREVLPLAFREESGVLAAYEQGEYVELPLAQCTGAQILLPASIFNK